jgi:hypothetical protein
VFFNFYNNFQAKRGGGVGGVDEIRMSSVQDDEHESIFNNEDD